MTSLLVMFLALPNAVEWKGFEYMGVHGAEFVVRDHTGLLVQCNEEQEEILLTVHVPHEDASPSGRQTRTLYVQTDNGETRSIEQTEDRPFPGVFQFEPEEWFVDFLLAGGDLVVRFEGETMEVPVDAAIMKETLDHCTGGTHAH
ncbi:MAG: hypothetical protein OXE58_10860 [Acidobacteria bacterium]|nr:hypothetical protein [Acidobacteriota bacterium]